jgi:hypothetical protein
MAEERDEIFACRLNQISKQRQTSLEIEKKLKELEREKFSIIFGLFGASWILPLGVKI